MRGAARRTVRRSPSALRPQMRGAAPVVAVPRVETLVGRELAGLHETARYRFQHDEDAHPSEILRKRSKPGQKLGELWDHVLESDAALSGLWSKRWKAWLGLPRYILPYDETPAAKETAEFCRLALERVPKLHINLQHQATGMTHGWAAEEILWQRCDDATLGGKWGIDLVDRPMSRFMYKDGRLHVRRADRRHGLAPDGKFLVNRCWSKDSPWGGRGLLDHVYWIWFSTQHGWKYFSILLEKWAQPTAIGKYRRGLDGKVNNQNVQRLYEAIDRIQTEYSIVIPDDLMVELLEAKRGGDVTYEKFLAIGNHAKALLFLGEGDTSGFESGQGSFARRRVSNEVRLETIRIDAREFDAHMTDNLLSLLVAVNFGLDAPVPRWYTEVEDAEDLRMRQERADAVLDRGLPLPLEDYYRINRQRMPRAGESVILRPDAGGVEVIDPPEGFDFISNAADPAARPPDDESSGYEGAPRERGLSPDESGGHLQTRLLPFNTPTERRALRRYRAGDIHDYQLAA